MMKHDRTIALVALALALLDASARGLIAVRFNEPVWGALLALPLGFVLAYILLGAARIARPDGLAIGVPVAGLLTIGDVVAARLATEGDAWHAELPVVCAASMFVVTIAVVRDTSSLERAGEALGAIGAILIALPLAPGIGVTRGGQSGWVQLGVQVSPAELGRVLVLLGFAAALSRLPIRRTQLGWQDVEAVARRALVIPAIAVLTHVIERDLGSALLLTLALAGVVAVAAGRMRWFGAAVASAAACLAVASLFSARVQGRVLDAVHPLRLVDGAYDQAGLAQLALAWGGWQGAGFGGGVTLRAGAIPAGATDYVLAEWALETGLVGLLLTMALFGWLLATAWTWSLRAPSGFPRLAASGMTWLLTVSTVWTTGAVLGFLPLSGLPSPFVSGASNATAMGVAAALLVRCTPSLSHADASLPDALALRAGRAVTVAAVLLVAVLAAYRISSDRLVLNRRTDNPLRGWINQNRGPIVSRDGTTLAYTTGAGSLDTVDRRYREAALTAGIVGRVSFADQSGGGIENAWRALLRCGGSGQARASGESWSAGATRVEGDPARCKPDGLRTSLDLDVQRAATAALRGRRGAIVVLDARTGAILATAGRLGVPAATTPLAGFELLVAPGSTFKIVTAAAALGAGIATDTPLASGFAAPGGRWLSNAGGETCGGTLHNAFVHSCNSSFALLGVNVGAGRLDATADRFGFGSRVAVSGLQAPASSLNAAANPFDADTLASSSIGQGAVAATPLQMALVTATVAAGGERPSPTLIDGICGKASVTTSTRRVISASTAREIARAMRGVTVAGTGGGAADVPGAWALKTGTAEVPQLSQSGSPAGTAGWIVGFPTAPLKSRVLPVVAGVVLPDTANSLRSGPQDGVAMISELARATLSARGPRADCD